MEKEFVIIGKVMCYDIEEDREGETVLKPNKEHDETFQVVTATTWSIAMREAAKKELTKHESTRFMHFNAEESQPHLAHAVYQVDTGKEMYQYEGIAYERVNPNF